MNKNNSKEEMTIKSRTENLSEIREFVSAHAEKAGLAKGAIDKIILAVDEACTNIIKHAYKSFPDGEIIVKAKRSNGKFTITIVDHGKPFEPESVPLPDLKKYCEEKRVGGLGIYLMKTLMDEVKYVSVPGKYNQVMLSKNLSSQTGMSLTGN